MSVAEILKLYLDKSPTSARDMASYLDCAESTHIAVRELMRLYKVCGQKIFWCEVAHLLGDIPASREL